MELFKDGDSVTMLPCGHLFNTNAIDEWLLNSQAKCPVCRHSLKNVKEIRITPTPRDVSNNTELPIHTNNSTNDINYILSNLFRNYLMQPLNSIENVDIKITLKMSIYQITLKMSIYQIMLKMSIYQIIMKILKHRQIQLSII